jgi:hypothetical protein
MIAPGGANNQDAFTITQITFGPTDSSRTESAFSYGVSLRRR